MVNETERQVAREGLADLGVTQAWLGGPPTSDEVVVLLDSSVLASVGERSAAAAVSPAFPGRKVWVASMSGEWPLAEPL